jgi:hypothetical protein
MFFLIKVLSQRGQSLSRRLCMYDAMAGSFHTLALPPRSPACAVCGDRPSITALRSSADLASECGLRGAEGSSAPAPHQLPPEHSITCQVRDAGLGPVIPPRTFSGGIRGGKEKCCLLWWKYRGEPIVFLQC